MTDTPQTLASAALDAALLALAAAGALRDTATANYRRAIDAYEIANDDTIHAANVYDAACELVTAARASAGFEA